MRRALHYLVFRGFSFSPNGRPVRSSPHRRSARIPPTQTKLFATKTQCSLTRPVSGAGADIPADAHRPPRPLHWPVRQEPPTRQLALRRIQCTIEGKNTPCGSL